MENTTNSSTKSGEIDEITDPELQLAQDIVFLKLKHEWEDGNPNDENIEVIRKALLAAKERGQAESIDREGRLVEAMKEVSGLGSYETDECEHRWLIEKCFKKLGIPYED